VRTGILAAAVVFAAAVRPVDAEPVSTGRRALAVGAAILPGAAVHGAGSWVVGDRTAARRLALAEAAGLTVAAVGGVPLALTYGSRRLATVSIPLVVAGSGVVVVGWLADMWVAAGGARIAGAPRRLEPWAVELGTTWVRDPVLGGRGFARLGAVWQLGPLRLAPEAMISVDDDEQRLELLGAWRLVGAAPCGEVAIGDGSHVELRAAIRGDRAGDEGFSLATVEAYGHGRLDLARVAAGLDGTFAELATGLGLELAAYRADGVDANDLLVARFGFGVYLGRGRGELTAWYDHRRDDLAGGLVASRASGFFGSVGSTVDVGLVDGWALTAELQVGSAWVGTLAVRRRGGGS